MNNINSVRNLIDETSSHNQIRFPLFSNWLRKKVIKKLNQLQYGQLKIIDGENEYLLKGDSNLELKAQINVIDPQFYWFIVLGGSIGAGEAYINNFWETSDLTKVVQVLAVNQTIQNKMDNGFGLNLLTEPFKKSFHWFNKNTLSGSKSNIVAHYDLGNEFFSHFLDSSMMYSSGIFLNKSDTMQQASINKLKRICQQLRLNENDHVVEIGTGWGGFAIYAAQNYGCKITTTTKSEEQYIYTKEKIESLGLTDKITLLKEDYRNLVGKFDKLVSIEMIEAVGYEFYDVFFKKCSDLVKEQGEILIQSITILDQKFNSSKKEVDFIKRYIFPGGCLPSINEISQRMTKRTDLRIHNIKDIGMDYAFTLEKWREAFFGKIDCIKAQGFNDTFIRLWNFYLCYCEGAFRERVISTAQLHMVKPLARVPLNY